MLNQKKKNYKKIFNAVKKILIWIGMRWCGTGYIKKYQLLLVRDTYWTMYDLNNISGIYFKILQQITTESERKTDEKDCKINIIVKFIPKTAKNNLKFSIL